MILTLRDTIAMKPPSNQSFEESRREAHLSAAQQAPQAHSRISQADAHDRRPPDPFPSSPQGPQAADGDGGQEVTLTKGGSPETLPRVERLRKRREFVAVQGSGRKLHTDSFLVFVRARADSVDRPARLGVTVSKKVGGAIERNRVKRLVREAFRRQKALFPTGHDVVFVAKRSAVEADFERVKREIERLCRKHFAT
jgi:ribonuclease P protein component